MTKVLADYAAMSATNDQFNNALSDGTGTERGEQSSSTELPPAKDAAANRPKEIGGREGPEPTRFGDWEKAGRCIDF